MPTVTLQEARTTMTISSTSRTIGREAAALHHLEVNRS
jgi:hypothetical protein